MPDIESGMEFTSGKRPNFGTLSKPAPIAGLALLATRADCRLDKQTRALGRSTGSSSRETRRAFISKRGAGRPPHSKLLSGLRRPRLRGGGAGK